MFFQNEPNQALRLILELPCAIPQDVIPYKCHLNMQTNVACLEVLHSL